LPRPSAAGCETSISSGRKERMMDSTHKLNELFDQTEKLLAKLADERGPEIQEVRDRLGKSMAQTREALKNGEHPERVKVRDVAASLNDYVRNYPWVALLTGVLVASTIGILSTSATRRSLHH
jgi:ElaB/YqjD/DUF883 family membrane-anchored ribosome-binding protein